MRSITNRFSPETRSGNDPRFAEPLVPQEALDVLLYEFPQLFVADLVTERDRARGQLALATVRRRNAESPLRWAGMSPDAAQELWAMLCQRYGHDACADDLRDLVEQILNDVPLLDLRRGEPVGNRASWRAGNRRSLIEVMNLLSSIRELRLLDTTGIESGLVDRLECLEAQPVERFYALAQALGDRLDAPLPPVRADTSPGMFSIMRCHVSGDADSIITAMRAGGGAYELWINPLHPLAEPLYPWFGDWNPAYLFDGVAFEVADATVELIERHGAEHAELRLPQSSARRLVPRARPSTRAGQVE